MQLECGTILWLHRIPSFTEKRRSLLKRYRSRTHLNFITFPPEIGPFQIQLNTPLRRLHPFKIKVNVFHNKADFFFTKMETLQDGKNYHFVQGRFSMTSLRSFNSSSSKDEHPFCNCIKILFLIKNKGSQDIFKRRRIGNF